MKMKSKLAVLVISLPFAIAACSDENSKVRGEFLAGCVQGGASKGLCSCVFEKLEDSYTTAELQKLNKTYPPPQRFVEDSIKFALECRAE
ncbi:MULTISPECIES: hypothetical protein [unclassified Pseudomonas]|uniref:hypothetical protein n=1 Tax=unclassified Pseudomonas TaxID=196821 RepID=UPI002448970B|nr:MULTISPECIES: hypothetical protein [unclassified Pseudomonas]MDH0894866.1 hypothetical protein [Pseudomonas sp. GD03875]MDH1063936.1 hypothetical protein [Pseudomonas sp. GD03985]